MKEIVGRTINQFRVLELVGRGGMGVVYKARDERLGRTVALKFLSSEFSRNLEALERFKREATIASSSNHPHICSVYDISFDEETQTPFIAMEFLEGETLKERLTQGPLDFEQLLEVSIQIADALHAAHEKDVVHRDLKPGNIFITTGGHSKLLDFGLAKIVPKDRNRKQNVSPYADTITLQTSLTSQGTAMGTAAYMSPEQARGKELDRRTDLFSFGAVMYEMATGDRAFQGHTLPVVHDAVLNTQPPPPSSRNPSTPTEFDKIVSKALEKDCEVRYQSCRDLIGDLKRLRRDLIVSASTRSLSPGRGGSPPTGGPGESLNSRTRSRTGWIWGTMGAVAVLATLWFVFLRSPGSDSLGLEDHSFEQVTSSPGEELFTSLSPEGNSVAYTALGTGNWDIYVQRVGGEKSSNLTEDSLADDTQPAFSPDGNTIAFRSERLGGGIWIMGASGESPRRLTDFGFNASWSTDGKEIVFATERIVDNPSNRSPVKSELWAIDVTTLERRLITKGDAVQPHWSPNGLRIAYWYTEGGKRDIRTIDARGGEPVAVTDDMHLDWNPVWGHDGKHLYFASDRGGTLNIWVVAMDEATGHVLGPLRPVTTGGSGSRQHISISADGRRIAFVESMVQMTLERVRFDVDQVEPVAITSGARIDAVPDPSPDGEWLAFSTAGKQEDIVIIRPDGSGQRNLTNDTHKDRLPRWSPTGDRIAFFSNRSGDYAIWSIKPDGSGLAKLTESPSSHPVWSPDGSRLAYLNPENRVVITSMAGQPAETLPAFGDSEYFQPTSWSPEGTQLTGEILSVNSETGGQIGVYSFKTRAFRKFPKAGAAPVWLNDSRRLLFWHRDQLHIVDTVSNQIREDVFNVFPDRLDVTFSLSRDNKVLYFTHIKRQSDVWAITRK